MEIKVGVGNYEIAGVSVGEKVDVIVIVGEEEKSVVGVLTGWQALRRIAKVRRTENITTFLDMFFI